MNKNQTLLAAFLRVVTHPLVLVMAAIASVALWMPYGFGYYGRPWWLIQLFAVGFPVSAAYACHRSFEPKAARWEFRIATASLLIGLLGLWHMLTWTFRDQWRPDF